MSARLGRAAAAIGYGAYRYIKHVTTSQHDRLLEETFDEVDRRSSDQRTIQTDHIAPSGSDGTPELVNGFRPDLVLTDFASANLVVEVETADSLDPDLLEQLDAFRTPGYRRVLVVPSGVETEARQFVSDLDGVVTVTTPDRISHHM